MANIIIIFNSSFHCSAEWNHISVGNDDFFHYQCMICSFWKCVLCGCNSRIPFLASSEWFLEATTVFFAPCLSGIWSVHIVHTAHETWHMDIYVCLSRPKGLFFYMCLYEYHCELWGWQQLKGWELLKKEWKKAVDRLRREEGGLLATCGLHNPDTNHSGTWQSDWQMNNAPIFQPPVNRPIHHGRGD